LDWLISIFPDVYQLFYQDFVGQFSGGAESPPRKCYWIIRIFTTAFLPAKVYDFELWALEGELKERRLSIH